MSKQVKPDELREFMRRRIEGQRLAHSGKVIYSTYRWCGHGRVWSALAALWTYVVNAKDTEESQNQW